jgi:hypothetical protein
VGRFPEKSLGLLGSRAKLVRLFFWGAGGGADGDGSFTFSSGGRRVQFALLKSALTIKVQKLLMRSLCVT